MSAMSSQITSASIVCSTVCSDADQRKHQSSTSLAFVRGTIGHRWTALTKPSNAENVPIWWRHHDINWIFPNEIPDISWVCYMWWSILGPGYIRYPSFYISWRHHDMKTLSALPVLCEGNPPVTGRFPSQRVSNVENWCFLDGSQNKLSNKQWTLEWRHNGRDSVSNHQSRDCLHNRLSRRISKKTSKLRVTGLCAGNSPGTGEFPAQRTSNAENVFIWWRHHELLVI